MENRLHTMLKGRSGRRKGKEPRAVPHSQAHKGGSWATGPV